MIGDMDIEYHRKIQVTGGSTYIVSLPKKWVKKHRLSVGNTVKLIELSDGRLILSLAEKKEKKPMTSIIIVSDYSCTPHTILRKIISNYLVGYDIIIIKSEEGILRPDCKNVIKESVRRILFGAEFMDEAAEFIKIQVLTPYINLPIKDIIKRMSDLAINMHYDVIKALEYDDPHLLNEIIDRDDDIDRLYFLSIRQLIAALYSNTLSCEIGIGSLHECLEYRLVVRHLERVADHATIIARMLIDVLKNINSGEIKILKSMNEMVRKALSTAIDALINKDTMMAEDAIKMRGKVRVLEEKALKKISMYRKPHVIAGLRMAIESYRRVSEYSAGIAEIAINISVKKPE